MSKRHEEACRHGCKLWYCLDDEIYHCYNCYDSLNICDKYTLCLRYRRITKHPCFIVIRLKNHLCVKVVISNLKNKYIYI